MTIAIWEASSQDAADARQVPLHLQPARPLARLPGRLHARRRRGARLGGRRCSRSGSTSASASSPTASSTTKDKAWFEQDVMDAAARGDLLRRRQGVAAQVARATLSTSCATATRTPRRARSCRRRTSTSRPSLGRDARQGACTDYMERFNEAFKLNAVDLVLLRRRARAPHAHRAHPAHAARLGAARRRRRLGQAVADAPRRVHGRATFFQITITKQYNANNLIEDFKPLYRRRASRARASPSSSPTRRSRRSPSSSTSTSSSTPASCPTSSRATSSTPSSARPPSSTPSRPTRRGEEPTHDDLWAFFIDRVRANLHLSLCFSPVGPKFSRARAEVPRLLINGCTVDWFLPWPEFEALTDVARHFMGSLRDPLTRNAVRRARARSSRTWARCTPWMTTASTWPRTSSSATAARPT